MQYVPQLAIGFGKIFRVMPQRIVGVEADGRDRPGSLPRADGIVPP